MIWLGEIVAGETVPIRAQFHADTGAAVNPTSPFARMETGVGTFVDLATPTQRDSRVGFFGVDINTAGFAEGLRTVRIGGTVPTDRAVAAVYGFRVVARRAEAIPTNPLLTNDSRLANLDAPVSARPTNPLLTNDARLAHLNAPVSAIPTNPLLTTDTRLGNLDAAVSSRVATTAYVAPDNTNIVAARDAAAAGRDRANLIPTNPLLTTDPRIDAMGGALKPDERAHLFAILPGDIAAARTASEAVNARISTAGITVTPVLLPGMRLLLMRDFDYPSIDFADTSWPSLTGNVVTISIDGNVYTTTVISASAFQLTLTRAQTLTLPIGLHPMHAEVLIGTQRRLLFTGICEIANVS